MSNPGPGRYYSFESEARVKSRSPSCTIGRAPRIMTVTFLTPGPSDYNLNKDTIMTRGPTYRIGLKTSPKRENIGPGPAKYNPESSSLTRKSATIGDTKRGIIDSKPERSPGPGDYNA